MDALLADLSEHWRLYLSIPFIAALIGYVTKRVAIEMMFKPAEFIGIKPVLGWQGVVPRYDGRIAGIAADLLTTRLIDPHEVFARIDPARVNAALEQPLLRAIDDIARDALAENHLRIWESMPPIAQDLVIKQVQAGSPRVVRQLIDELRSNVDAVLDVRQLATEVLLRDKTTLVRMVRDLARPELAFIARFGIYSGFALGIAQTLVWAVTKEPLVMPIFGAAIGLFTDWLAIQLVFVPREPVRLFGLQVQGRFHRRRAEVAEHYGRLIATEVLTVQNLLDAILRGPRADRVYVLVERMVATAIEEQSRIARPMVALTVGDDRLQQLKRSAAGMAMAQFAETSKPAHGYVAEAMDVANLITERMLALPADSYESLLRPAFRQDEWKLITVGGVIGALVGELQVLLMLG